MESGSKPFRLETDVTGRLKALGVGSLEEGENLSRTRYWSDAGDGIWAAIATAAAIIVPTALAITALSGIGRTHEATPAKAAIAILVLILAGAVFLAETAFMDKEMERRAKRRALEATLSWHGTTTDVAHDRFTITRAERSRTYHMAAVTAFEASPEDGFESLRIHLLQGHVDVPWVQPGHLTERFKDMLRRKTVGAASA